MTLTKSELRDLGVSEIAIAFRTWRREMHLTQAEAAAVVGVNVRTLIHVELGDRHVSQATIDKVTALMSRWDESMRPARRPDGRGAHIGRVRAARAARGDQVRPPKPRRQRGAGRAPRLPVGP